MVEENLLRTSARARVALRGWLKNLRWLEPREWLLIASALCPLWFCTLDAAPSTARLALSCLVLCVVSAANPKTTDELLQRTWLRRSLALAVGLSVAWLLIGQSHAARWWIIDDHEIADALSNKRARRLSGLWEIFSTHVEILAPSFTFPRYRPSYYTLRYLECAIWGLRPDRWYIARILMFAASVALTFSALVRLSGPLLASLTIVLLATPDFWVDVWCRLGPAEQYTTLGSALFAAGAAGILRQLLTDDEKPKPLYWCLAAVGSLIASGSKENFLIIPAMVGGLFVIALLRRRSTVPGLVATLVSVAYAAWIAFVVYTSIKAANQAAYGAPPEVRNVSELLTRSVQDFWSEVGWIALGSFATTCALIAYRRWPCCWRHLLMLGLAIVMPALVYASQLLFYQGNLPAHMRYDFPAQLMFPLSLCLIGAVMVRIAHEALAERASMLCGAGVIVAVAILAGSPGFGHLKASVLANVARTQAFTEGLDKVVKAGKAHRKRPFVLFVNNDGAYEPAVSVRIFMRSKGLKNPAYLAVNYEAPTPAFQQLKSWQTEGRQKWDHAWSEPPNTIWMFRPFSELKTTRKPLGIGLWGAPVVDAVPVASF